MTIVSARYTYRYPYKWPVISFCFLYRWTFQLIASTYTSFISLLRTFPDWSHSKGKWYLYLVLTRPHCSSCVTVLSVWKWDPILLNIQKWHKNWWVSSSLSKIFKSVSNVDICQFPVEILLKKKENSLKVQFLQDTELLLQTCWESFLTFFYQKHVVSFWNERVSRDEFNACIHISSISCWEIKFDLGIGYFFIPSLCSFALPIVFFLTELHKSFSSVFITDESFIWWFQPVPSSSHHRKQCFEIGLIKSKQYLCLLF